MFFIDKVTLFDFLFFAFLPFSFALVRYSQLPFFFPYKSMSEYIFYSGTHSFALLLFTGCQSNQRQRADIRQPSVIISFPSSLETYRL